MSSLMESDGDLLALNEEDFRRFRRTFGFVDTLALSAEFDFPVGTEIKIDGTQTNEATKTLLHEITHVYQITATSYGYYIQALRDFQVYLVLLMLRYIRDNLGLKPVIPLFRQVKGLPSSDTAEQARRALFTWYLAELGIRFFEGDTSVYGNELVNGQFVSAHRPALENFVLLDRYLGDFLQRAARAAPPEPDEPVVLDDKEQQKREGLEHIVTFALRAFFGNIEPLIESAARAAEYWRQGGPVPAGLLSSRVKGDDLLRASAGRLGGADIGTIALTHSVLADLCMNPAILPHHRQYRNLQTRLIDIHPVLRWLTAHPALERVAPVRDLARDYERFVAEISELLGWPPLSDLNSAALAHTPSDGTDAITSLYRESLLIRQAEPYIFNDFDVWLGRQDPLAATLTHYFRPMVNVFADGQVLKHPDSELVTAFIRNFMLRQYARQTLLSMDLAVCVPYPASDEELAAWAGLLSEELISAGFTRPRVSVHGRSAQLHGRLK
jgi:hypothetical protein